MEIITKTHEQLKTDVLPLGLIESTLANKSNDTQKSFLKDLEVINRDFVAKELTTKVKSLDWKEVRRDVERLLKPEELDTLKLWEEDLFLEKIQKII